MTYGGRLEAFMTVPASTTITVTHSGGGPTSVSITAGSYTPTTFLAHVVTRINAVMPSPDFSGSLSTGTSGTGLVTLTCTGTWTITFTTAEVGTALGYVGNLSGVSSSQVGTQNARGLWIPDSPLNLQGNPKAAPEFSDMRSTEGPTGDVISLVGSYRYQHSGLRWSHVPRDKAWYEYETYPYASWQSWVRDTQIYRGHSWFAPGSAFQAYWDSAGTDVILGYELNASAGPTYGWKASPPISSIDPRRVDAAWLGRWTVEIPRIVSVG